MTEQHGNRSTSQPEAADQSLVFNAISRSDLTWLSAEAIAADTQLPVERIQRVLEASPADLIVEPRAKGAEPRRYSTREHYRKTTGLLKRYIDAVVSS